MGDAFNIDDYVSFEKNLMDYAKTVVDWSKPLGHPYNNGCVTCGNKITPKIVPPEKEKNFITKVSDKYLRDAKVSSLRSALFLVTLHAGIKAELNLVSKIELAVRKDEFIWDFGWKKDKNEEATNQSDTFVRFNWKNAIKKEVLVINDGTQVSGEVIEEIGTKDSTIKDLTETITEEEELQKTRTEKIKHKTTNFTKRKGTVTKRKETFGIFTSTVDEGLYILDNYKCINKTLEENITGTYKETVTKLCKIDAKNYTITCNTDIEFNDKLEIG